MNTLFLLLTVISLLGIPIFIVLALINLIRKNSAKKRFKWAGISVLTFIAGLVGFGFTMEPPIAPESIELSIPDYQAEYDINAKIPINITVSPENADIGSLEYISDGNTLTFSESGIITGSEEGSFDIYVQSGDITSNTLSINVINITAREEAKALELAKAEEEKRLAEEKAAKEAEQKRLAEEKAAQEAEQKKLAEEKAAQEAEQTRSAEEKAENPLGFNVMFSKTYRNDMTGNWRLTRIAENINIEEYALDYYKNYFEADNEIHIVINFTLNTTTKIAVIGNLIDVAVMEYVDGEEHDATIACSGTLLNEYHVNINTGEIEKLPGTKAENETAQEKTSEVSSDSETAQQSASEQTVQKAEQPKQVGPESNTQNNATPTGNNSNFNTYDNAAQQETSASYVLNTSTHKIHYPSCKSVKKIAPQNYSTSNSSIEELISQGYTTCGNCF